MLACSSLFLMSLHLQLAILLWTLSPVLGAAIAPVYGTKLNEDTLVCYLGGSIWSRGMDTGHAAPLVPVQDCS